MTLKNYIGGFDLFESYIGKMPPFFQRDEHMDVHMNPKSINFGGMCVTAISDKNGNLFALNNKRCHITHEQLGAFLKSQRYLNYVGSIYDNLDKFLLLTKIDDVLVLSQVYDSIDIENGPLSYDIKTLMNTVKMINPWLPIYKRKEKQ